MLRSKEEADDYRYFPEPDLVPMEPVRRADRAAALGAARAAGGPLARASSREFGLSLQDADVLNQTPAMASYFEELAALTGDAKASANWIMGELSAHLNEHALEIGESPVSPVLARAADRARRRRHARLGGCQAGLRGARRRRGGGDARAIVEQRGLAQIADEGALRAVVEEVVAANPGQAAEYRAGKDALLGYFVGQVMRSTGGRAEPRAVQELLREALRARPDGRTLAHLEPR